MKRRAFVDLAGKAALLAPFIAGCSINGGLPDNSQQVATPEKRRQYLDSLLKKLCTELGPHPVGSPEYDRAALIVQSEMQMSLPQVFLDAFTFEKWRLNSEPELIVGEQRLETYPGHGASGTPAAGISGVLRKIEDQGGIPYGVFDQASGEMRAYLTLSQYGRAVPRPYYSFGKEIKCLPTFNVGRQDEPVLEEAIEKQTLVTLKALVDFIPDSRTGNVVGSLPGRSKKEILFLAHLDTVYSSPGANDNTASVVAMLMLAHALSGVKPTRTLTFVATTGEEYGKLGALHYAERRRAEGTLGDIEFLVNLDSVTWGPNMKINTADDKLMGLIEDIDRELGLEGTPVRDGRDGFQLDAAPFRESGARAVYVNSTGYSIEYLWHRPEDTPEKVPADCVEIWFRLFEEFTRKLLSA